MGQRVRVAALEDETLVAVPVVATGGGRLHFLEARWKALLVGLGAAAAPWTHGWFHGQLAAAPALLTPLERKRAWLRALAVVACRAEAAHALTALQRALAAPRGIVTLASLSKPFSSSSTLKINVE